VVLVSLVAAEELHAAAVVAKLNAALPAQVRAYDFDELPATRPANYIEVTVSRRFGGEQRSVASSTRGGWRVTTRSVSSVSVSNARKNAETVRAALESARLTVSSKKSTPVQFETADPIEPDDGWWSGLTAWTYAL
jgi:hypothetical protein